MGERAINYLCRMPHFQQRTKGEKWSEFLFAVTFLHTAELKSVLTSLYSFFSRYSRDWGLINAATIIMILPVIVLFLLLQRQFIQGLTQGGLKA